MDLKNNKLDTNKQPVVANMEKFLPSMKYLKMFEEFKNKENED